MNGENAMMWKEAVVANIKTFSWTAVT